MRTLDFRSDTLTQPSAGMREAMARAELGDDVYGEDPSVRALEEEVAGLLGFESALFVPSGTMSNQIALLVHTKAGDEVIVGHGAHLAWYESGAGAALSGVQFASVGTTGLFGANDVVGAIKPERDYHPRTSLVALENTHNRAGGRVFPERDVEAIQRVARERGLGLHLDGARIWNAALASQREALELARGFDSVSVCFSKGLGAPVGSALAASRDFVRRARRFRKMLGGGMRQAGILAAGALYALRHQRARLAEDHEHARLLAELLSESPRLKVNRELVETNIVVVELCAEQSERAIERLSAVGVRVGALDEKTLRFVTHLDLSRHDVLEGAARIRTLFAATG